MKTKKKSKLPRSPVPPPTKAIPNKKSAKVAELKRKEVDWERGYYGE